MSTTVDLPGSPRSGVWWSGGLEFAPPLTCAEVQTFAVGWVQIKFSWQEQVVRRAGASSVGLALGGQGRTFQQYPSMPWGRGQPRLPWRDFVGTGAQGDPEAGCEGRSSSASPVTPRSPGRRPSGHLVGGSAACPACHSVLSGTDPGWTVRSLPGVPMPEGLCPESQGL